MVKMIGAALCGIALSITAAEIAFNTPVRWGTVRSSDVVASFVVDSSLINSDMKLTLVQNVDGKEKVVSQKNITLKEPNNEHSFSVARPVPGGTDYHSIKWEVNGKKGRITPFGIAPVSNGIDPKAISAVKSSGEITTETFSKISGLSSTKVGKNEVSLAWTSSALAVIVKGSGTVSVALDPSNSKGSFLAFSNRTALIDFDSKSMKYNFFEREITDNSISYSEQPWSGEMNGEVKDGIAVITIPWYEIGTKPFIGRQMGILVKSGDALYPETAIEETPATWGNFILK